MTFSLRSRLLQAAAAAVAIAAFSPASASVATLFFEDFDEAPFSQTNFVGLSHFGVVDGFVDAFTNGGFGLSCPSLGCLDLDGSSLNAGRIETTGTFGLIAGVDYVLSINVRGNQRNRAADSLTFGLLDGGGVLASAPVMLASADDYRIETVMFSAAAATNATIFIDHDGGDNFGILLDYVQLDADRMTPGAVPVPAALPLLASGLGLMGLMGWRRRKA